MLPLHVALLRASGGMLCDLHEDAAADMFEPEGQDKAEHSKRQVLSLSYTHMC